MTPKELQARIAELEAANADLKEEVAELEAELEEERRPTCDCDYMNVDDDYTPDPEVQAKFNRWLGLDESPLKAERERIADMIENRAVHMDRTGLHTGEPNEPE